MRCFFTLTLHTMIEKSLFGAYTALERDFLCLYIGLYISQDIRKCIIKVQSNFKIKGDKKMSKIFFIEDKNGKYSSVDGKRKFIKLQGKKLKEYLDSDIGRKKIFDIDTDDKGNKIGVEITAEIKIKHLQDKRHRQYLHDTQKRFGQPSISLDSSVFNEDSTLEKSLMSNNRTDILEDIIYKLDLEKLNIALKSLTPEEYALISELYFSDYNLSARDISAIMGLSHTAINKRKNKILEKLRKQLA